MTYDASRMTFDASRMTPYAVWQRLTRAATYAALLASDYPMYREIVTDDDLSEWLKA